MFGAKMVVGFLFFVKILCTAKKQFYSLNKKSNKKNENRRGRRRGTKMKEGKEGRNKEIQTATNKSTVSQLDREK